MKSEARAASRLGGGAPEDNWVLGQKTRAPDFLDVRAQILSSVTTDPVVIASPSTSPTTYLITARLITAVITARWLRSGVVTNIRFGCAGTAQGLTSLLRTDEW
jgi:hypothetical protein